MKIIKRILPETVKKEDVSEDEESVDVSDEDAEKDEAFANLANLFKK